MASGPAAVCMQCGGPHAADAPCGEAPDARVGAIVADKYAIVRLIGRGGMGSVYEARHAVLSRRFAIKFLLPQFASHREILRRFENEAKAAGRLEHPNLAAVTDFGRAPDGSPFLVMEFLEGEDCARLLRRTGPLPAPRAANIVVQACRGLAVAHAAGIVHRDIKPENLFLTASGDGTDLVKILDFGIAKLLPSDASVATSTGAAMGTSFYMSPEQAVGAANVDERTDVWALGVVLYELLSGRRPFESEQFLEVIHRILTEQARPLVEMRAGLPAGLVALVEGAMKKEPGNRIRTVRALMDGLAPFAAPASVPRARAGSSETTHPAVTDAGSALTVLRRVRRGRGRLVARLAMVACGAGLVALLALRALGGGKATGERAAVVVAPTAPVAVAAAPPASIGAGLPGAGSTAPAVVAPDAVAESVRIEPAAVAKTASWDASAGPGATRAGSRRPAAATPVATATASVGTSTGGRAVTIDTASPY